MLCSCGDSKIKEGFSQNLTESLSKQYSIAIPENAEFIKEYNLSCGDNCVAVLFGIPFENKNTTAFDHICDKLKSDKEKYRFLGEDEEIKADYCYEETGGLMEFCIKTDIDPFAQIGYSVSDKSILLRFFGYRPHETYR